MAQPNDVVCEVRIKPLRNKVEIRYSDRIYSIDDGKWVGAAPSAARLRQIKSALSNALPKPPAKPKPKK